MNVQELTAHVRDVLTDADADTYSNSFIHESLYCCETVIASQRPESTVLNEEHTCVVGSRQQLDPETTTQLISIDHNGSAASPGTVINRVARNDVDTIDPNWRSATPGNAAIEYIYDEREPFVFHLNPPVVADHIVTLNRGVVPSPYGTVDAMTQTTVPAKYRQPMIEFALYMCFSSDTEGSPNITRANQHVMTFANLTGITWETIKTYSPKNRAYTR